MCFTILTPRSPPSLKKPSFPGSPRPPLYPPLSTSLTPSFMPMLAPRQPLAPFPGYSFSHSWELNILVKCVSSTPASSCLDSSLPVHPLTVHLIPPLPSSCPFHLPANDCMTSELIASIPLSDHFLLNQLPHTNRRQPMDASSAEVLARFLCLLYVSENWQGTEGTLKRV